MHAAALSTSNQRKYKKHNMKLSNIPFGIYAYYSSFDKRITEQTQQERF